MSAAGVELDGPLTDPVEADGFAACDDAQPGEGGLAARLAGEELAPRDRARIVDVGRRRRDVRGRRAQQSVAAAPDDCCRPDRGVPSATRVLPRDIRRGPIRAPRGGARRRRLRPS